MFLGYMRAFQGVGRSGREMIFDFRWQHSPFWHTELCSYL